jgi:hypothetical protein
MSDESTLAAARGHQADSEYRELDAAFAETRARLLEQIAQSAIGDTEFREKCFFGIQALDGVKSILLQVASGKILAEHDNFIRDVLAGRDAA